MAETEKEPELGNSIPPWARNQPWLVLPSMPAVTMDVPEMSYRSLPTNRVDLGQMTCSCSRWIEAARNKIPLRSLADAAHIWRERYMSA